MTIFHHTYSHLKSLPSAMWVLFSATFLNQLGFMVFPFLLLYLTQHMGFSLAQASFVFLGNGAALIFSSFIAGNVIDRIGPEKTMISALIWNALVLFVFVFLHSYWAIFIAATFLGIAYGAFRPAVQTLVSFLAPPGTQKIAFSVQRLATNLGMSMGPLIGSFIVAKHFPLIFMINAFANLIAVTIIFFGLKKAAYVLKRHVNTLSLSAVALLLKTDKNLRIFLLGFMLPMMVFMLHEGPLSIHLVRDLSFSYHFYGLLFTINTLMIVFLEILINTAMLQLSHRTCLIIGTLFVSFGFAGFAILKTAAGMIFLTVIWTLGEIMFFPAAAAFVSEISPEHARGSYMGMYNTASNLALTLSLWLGVLVMGYWGSTMLWIIAGVWGLFSLLFFIRLPVHEKTG